MWPTSPFDSDQSLLDADIVLYEPTLGPRTFLDAFVFSEYQGKPSLSESNSFSVKGHVAHWKSELLAASNADKLIVLATPIEVYVKTGEKQFSGTGRNRQVTNIVNLLSSYDTIPWQINVTARRGSRIAPAKDLGFLAPYWSAFGSMSSYEVTIGGKFAETLLVTKSGNHVVAAGIRGAGGGHVLFLPPIRYDEKTFIRKAKDEQFWTDKALQHGHSFTSEIISLATVLRVDTQLTPPPEWVSRNEYRLAAEAGLEKKIRSTLNQIDKLNATKTTLESVVAWIIPKDVLSLCFSTLGITWMPHKFNAARRHKFDKAQYRVIHWAEYNESLRQRGDLTIWVSDEAQSVWSAPRRTSRGGQRRYSDLAIETCLTLRTAYRLGLRQTQGLMGSIGTLMGLDIRVPDYSTLSRRANGLSIAQAVRQGGSVPVHLVVDSTGLKIFGEGEWLAQKHKTKGIRRRWRKLHLGLDLASGAIVCANLTHDDVGDSTALPGLLDQLDAPVTGFLADGAYDGAATRDLLRERYGETLDVVIPPPKNAVTRPQSARDPTVRDRHIAQIRGNGRMAWQAATGDNQRSRIETQIGRWKSVIGPKLKSRSFSRQITEIQVGQKVLNTMTALGRPVFERIA